jgi:hypothetical protein
LDELINLFGYPAYCCTDNLADGACMKVGTDRCYNCGFITSTDVMHHCLNDAVMHPLINVGIKADDGKPRLDLVDSYAIEELAKVLTFGANKYAAHNWRNGLSISRLVAALLRHVYAFMRGEDIDPETGLSHIAHAMCNCSFILWTMKNKAEQDDRWKSAIQSET